MAVAAHRAATRLTRLHGGGLAQLDPEPVQHISIIKLGVGGPDGGVQAAIQLVLRHLPRLVAQVGAQQVHQGLDEVPLAQQQVALEGVAVLHKAVLGENGFQQVLVNGCCCTVDGVIPGPQLQTAMAWSGFSIHMPGPHMLADYLSTPAQS